MNQMRFDDAAMEAVTPRRRVGRILVQFVIAAALIAAAVVGWQYREQVLGPAATARTQSAGRAVMVEVAPAHTGSVVRSVEAVGTVFANEAITVTPRVTGVISRVNVTEGQMVKAGAVLFELDGREALAELAAAKAVEENARALYERTKTLLEQRNTPQARFDEAASALKVAQARVKVVESHLADLRVVAPFAGKVGLRRVSLGALVSPGTVLTTLDDVETVKVDFSLPETALAAVKPGQEIRGRTDAYPGRDFSGVVRVIDSRVDAVTRAVNVRAEMANADGALKPGLFLTINLIVTRRDDSVLIPEEALVPVGTGQYVFVVRDGQAQRIEVKIGERRRGEVEIVEGLAPDARVIVGGVQKIRDGTRVTIAGGDARPTGDSSPRATTPGS